MKMNFRVLLATLMVLGFQANAQEGGLTYRDSDPFLFCTKGQDPRKEPLPCWRPMSPYTGAFAYMPYCQPINPYGKSWTNDDTKSLQEYLSVCPRAEKSGRWEGEGTPEMSPDKYH